MRIKTIPILVLALWVAMPLKAEVPDSVQLFVQLGDSCMQQFGGLTVVATFIITVGQLRPHLYGVRHLEGLLVIAQRLEGIILLHTTVAQLNEQLN